MQAKQMSASLHLIAPLLESRSEQCMILVRIGDALADGDNITVATALRKVLNYLKERKKVPAISDCVLLTDRISKITQASGSKTIAKDFALISSLIQSYSTLTAEEWYKAFSDALMDKPKKTTPSQQLRNATPDPHKLAADLVRAAEYNEKFDYLIQQISKLQKNIIVRVAHEFLGYEKSYKTKDDAVEAITARQLQDAIERSRERRISKIAV